MRNWAARMPAEQFYLSAVVLLELRSGYELKARTDAPQAGRLKVWIEGLEAAYDGRTLPFTARDAQTLHASARPQSARWARLSDRSHCAGARHDAGHAQRAGLCRIRCATYRSIRLIPSAMIAEQRRCKAATGWL